jgi:hypothetical protein
MKVKSYNEDCVSENELGSQILQSDTSRELGQKHGGVFTKVDYEMRQMRLRTIVLGYGWYPLEGCGQQRNDMKCVSCNERSWHQAIRKTT